jgi:hypothetical protein
MVWTTPHIVQVGVEVPGAAAEGVLEIAFPSKWGGENLVTRPIEYAPVLVRVMPGEAPLARARVMGYAVVEAPLPTDATTLTLRPSVADDTGCVRIEFVPSPDLISEGFVQSRRRYEPGKVATPVRVSLTGNETFSIEIESVSPVTEARTVPAGRYRVRCTVRPSSAPPEGDICKPVWIDVRTGETTDVRLTEFDVPQIDARRIVCKDSRIRGYVAGEEADAPGVVNPVATLDVGILCVHDGDQRHGWTIVPDGDKKVAELRLPPRIEVRFGNGFTSSDAETYAPEVQIDVDFNGPGWAIVDSQTKNTSAWLWAPPGWARIRVWTNGLHAPAVDWRRAVRVPAEGVVVVEIDDDQCSVNFDGAADYAESAEGIAPRWGVWTEQGKFLRWVGGRELLPAGTYSARPAFGPEATRHVQFTATPGRTNEVKLFKLGSVSNAGHIRLNRPKSVEGEVDVAAWFRPAAWSSEVSWWFGRGEARESATDDSIDLRGLLVGVPIWITVAIYVDGNEVAECEFITVLPETNFRSIAVNWTLPTKD